MTTDKSLMSSLTQALSVAREASIIFDEKKAAYEEAYKLAYSSKSLEEVRLSAESYERV